MGERRHRKTGRAQVRRRRYQWFGPRGIGSIAVTPAPRFCNRNFDIALARRVARGTSQEPNTVHRSFSYFLRYRRTTGKALVQPGGAQQGWPRPSSMDLSPDGQWPPRSIADRQSGAASLGLDAHTTSCSSARSHSCKYFSFSASALPLRRDRQDPPPHPLQITHITQAGVGLATGAH